MHGANTMDETDVPITDRFRNALSEYCEAQRGRQTELAALLNRHRSEISDWLRERGFPNGATVLQILAWLPREVRNEILEPGYAPTVAELVRVAQAETAGHTR